MILSKTRYTFTRCSIQLVLNRMNYTPDFTAKERSTPKRTKEKLDYAGSQSDFGYEESVFPMSTNAKPYPNIFRKNIIWTDVNIGKAAFDDYLAKGNTVIYAKPITWKYPDGTISEYPDPKGEAVEQRNCKCRRGTDEPFYYTWSMSLDILKYNKPRKVTFVYRDYAYNYPQSVNNTQKQLSMHGTRVRLIDKTLGVTLEVPPVSSGTEKYIKEPNRIAYYDFMRPYINEVKNYKALLKDTGYDKPKPISKYILSFVSVLAPAYGIPVPSEPDESAYNYFDEMIYSIDIMKGYEQLKFYIKNGIPMDTDYTICTHCHLPVLQTAEECSLCLTPRKDIWTDAKEFWYTDSGKTKRYSYRNNPIWDDVQDPEHKPDKLPDPKPAQETQHLCIGNTPTKDYGTMNYSKLWKAIAENDIDW